MWVRGRLVVKLPSPRVSELIAAGVATHFDANKGIAMKEWATILDPPPRSRKPRPTVLELVREAHTFVSHGRAAAKPRR